MTLIRPSKREPIFRGSRVYSIELINPEDLEDGLPGATLPIETSDPRFAERFAINESYTFQLPG